MDCDSTPMAGPCSCNNFTHWWLCIGFWSHLRDENRLLVVPTAKAGTMNGGCCHLLSISVRKLNVSLDKKLVSGVAQL